MAMWKVQNEKRPQQCHTHTHTKCIVLICIVIHCCHVGIVTNKRKLAHTYICLVSLRGRFLFLSIAGLDMLCVFEPRRKWRKRCQNTNNLYIFCATEDITKSLLLLLIGVKVRCIRHFFAHISVPSLNCSWCSLLLLLLFSMSHDPL